MPNASNELHSITVNCTIHPDSTADQCVVMAMADGRVTRTGDKTVYSMLIVFMPLCSYVCCLITYPWYMTKYDGF